MAKKKQKAKGKTSGSVPAKTKKKKSSPKVVFPPVQQSFIPAKYFWIAFGVVALLTFGFAWNAGINGDDQYQIDYSNKLVDYYSSMGQDTSALYIEKGKMHYYGGFFEILAGGATSVLGLDENDIGYHRVRHLLIAVFGLLTLLFAALLVQQLTGWHGALITLILLFLSPRFFGHSLMNPKDIPFACGYMISLYYIFRWLVEIPKVSRKTLIGLTIGIAMAISTRVGGLLVVGYLGLFAGIHFLFSVLLNKSDKNKTAAFLSNLKFGTIPIVLGLLIAMLFWPFALASPIDNISAALAEFSKLGVEIRILFEGNNIMSADEPWYYPFLWMWNTLPLHVLIGIIGALGGYILWAKKYKHAAFHLIAFAAVFPLTYLVYKGSVLHDGWRHLIFAFIPLAVLAGLFWTELYQFATTKGKQLSWGVLVVFGLLCAQPFWYILKNGDLSYTYFNPLAGGIKGAYGEYELDYWGISVLEAVEWLEKEGKLDNNGGVPIKIYTNFYFNASKYLRKRYEGKVTVDYIKFSTRFDEEWDYGIFVNRFINGTHLQSGKWPSGRSIHTIDVNGVPVCTILEKGGNEAFAARAAEKSQNFSVAVAQYEAELLNYPDNELAWIGLANAALNVGDINKSKNAAKQALEIDAKNTNAIYYHALATLNGGDREGAKLEFNRVLELDDRFFLANYFLGLIAKDEGRDQEAFEQFRTVLKYNPKFRQAYIYLAEIYEKNGDAQNAANMRARAQAIQ